MVQENLTVCVHALRPSDRCGELGDVRGTFSSLDHFGMVSKGRIRNCPGFGSVGPVCV